MRLYYHSQHGTYIRNIYRRIFYRYLVKKYLKDCKTIMDVGSGAGVFYDVAVKLGKEITGIDLDKENIRDNIILKNFKDIKEEYDCFYCSQIIEHVNQFELMEKAKKYCKKVLIITTERPTKKFWGCPSHIRPYSKKALKWMLESYGFKVIGVWNMHPSRGVIVIGIK